MWGIRFSSVALVVVVALIGCAPAAPRLTQTAEPPSSSAPAAQPAASGRPLNMAVRYEVNDLAPKRTGGASWEYTKRAFNAYLTVVGAESKVYPYLAET